MDMKKNKILIFSNDQEVLSLLKKTYEVETASSRSGVLKSIEEDPGILAVIDCDMKDAGGLSLYKEIKKHSPDTPVLMLSSAVTIPEAVEASKIGVADFIRKPASSERLLGSVSRNLSRGEGARLMPASRLGEWLQGSGNKIRTLLKNLEFAVKERKNILFISEPGTDILSLVKIICDYSGRGKKTTSIDMLTYKKESIENIFWMVLQEALASSDIIYFERFSAADEKHQASILDYIKNKALGRQVKLIAGAKKIEAGEIFNDWEKITVPSLRERKEDLPDILGAYIDSYSAKYGKRIDGIGFDALKAIGSYSWPGNYRELECVMENAVLTCGGSTITLKDVQLGSKMVFESLQSSQTESLLDFKNDIEKNLVNIFYKKTGSEDMTANLLDIPKSRVSESVKK